MMIINVFIMIMFLSMLFLGIFYLLSRRKASSKKRVTSKRMISIFGGYTAVLFLAMCIYYVLPKEEAAGRDSYSDSLDEMYVESDELQRLALAGEFEKIPEKYLKSAQSFRYDQDRIELNIPSLENNSIMVIIEKDEGSNDQIEVRYYKAPLRINGVDISDQIIEDVDVDEREGRIAISQVMYHEFSFHQFSEPLVLSQFNKDSYTGLGFSFHNGTQILYLSIPENVEIDGLDEELIFYVD